MRIVNHKFISQILGLIFLFMLAAFFSNAYADEGLGIKIQNKSTKVSVKVDAYDICGVKVSAPTLEIKPGETARLTLSKVGVCKAAPYANIKIYDANHQSSPDTFNFTYDSSDNVWYSPIPPIISMQSFDIVGGYHTGNPDFTIEITDKSSAS